MDKEWVSSAFFVPESEIESYNRRFKTWSSADHKIVSTRLGGHIAINPRPQFTRYADPRRMGLVSGRSRASTLSTGGGHGLGKYYNDSIDDNAELVHIRVGITQYTSLQHFTRLMFDPDYAYFVNTGKQKSGWVVVGNIIGAVIGVRLFGVIGFLALASRGLAVFLGQRSSRFCSFKPAAHMYWSACNVFVNSIAINENFMAVKRERDDDDRTIENDGGVNDIDVDSMAIMHDLMPDIYLNKYGIDMFAIAGKTQRMENKRWAEKMKKLDTSSPSGLMDWLVDGDNKRYSDDERDSMSLSDFVKKFTSFGQYEADGSGGKDFFSMDPKSEGGGGDGSPIHPKDEDDFFNYFDAMNQSGADFVVFRINNIKTVSESFSTQVGESEISVKVNSASGSARETRFSLAGGNIGDGVVANALESAGGAIMDVISGAADSMSLGMSNILRGLFGIGYADFPKIWKTSTVQLPKTTMVADLSAPYNNSISRLINIHVPLSCLLPLVMPLSTGRQTFSSPFALQVFIKGKIQSRYCMMESVTIERGIHNVSFDADGHCSGVRVSFSYVDMASVIHMPISTGTLFNADEATDSDNVLYDYLAVLSGLDIKSQIYKMPKAQLAWAKRKTGWQLATSTAAWASYAHASMDHGIINTMTLGASGLISGIAAAPLSSNN